MIYKQPFKVCHERFLKCCQNMGLACLIIIFELDGMNILGIGFNVFALPQFNMLKSIVQQFFRLIFAKENPS